ncbi:MAG: hypothetical protein HY677_00565, partial [Chloroflexi bacterium]|nr:hypothetical protein [Chloroflexota bacterium]
MKKMLLSALTMLLIIAALVGVATAGRPGFLGSSAEAAVPGPIGSKDCIAYCELNGIVS